MLHRKLTVSLLVVLGLPCMPARGGLQDDGPPGPVVAFVAGLESLDVDSLHSSNIYPRVAAAGSATEQPSTTQASPLADPSRLPADLQRDAGSKPLEVFSWLGIRAGMTVGDLVPFSGYNTHILSRLVGPEGKVYAAFNIPRQQPELDARLAQANLGNVVVAADLSGVADDSVDVYVTIRNIHDFYIPSVVEAAQLVDRETLFGEVRRTLAPGGILGVVDVRTTREGVDPETHRINEDKVIADLEAMGFELVDRSEMLAEPSDDQSAAGFPQRWKVDRLLLKFTKAAGR